MKTRKEKGGRRRRRGGGMRKVGRKERKREQAQAQVNHTATKIQI